MMVVKIGIFVKSKRKTKRGTLGQRLQSLPDRLKVCKSKRPNLAEICMSLKDDKNFIHHSKRDLDLRAKTKRYHLP